MVGLGDGGGSPLAADVPFEKMVLPVAGSFVVVTAGLFSVGWREFDGSNGLVAGAPLRLWFGAGVPTQAVVLTGLQGTVSGEVSRTADAIVGWLGFGIACLELAGNDSIHPEKHMAVNRKRKTLPPRTLGSVPGLMPCLQERRAKARSTKVSPGKAYLGSVMIPTRRRMQPSPPVTGTAVPNFVFVGFQKEYFCAG